MDNKSQAKKQHSNILLAILGFVIVVAIVALIGFLIIDRDPDNIQGQVEVAEYRVSSKVPGRIKEIRVREGDFVHAGDTLAILEAPEVMAKMQQAQSAEDAAAAMEQMARNGARKEQIQGAFEMLQKANVGLSLAEKSYKRAQHLFDEGVVNTPEPYQKRTSHGMILGENGEKMSKSRGNVVNPDDIVREYGADTLRTYEMFIGAFDLAASWSEDGVKGCRRFLERVWKLQDILTDGDGYSDELAVKMHQTIKKVSDDYESLKYNTAIAAMMSLINEFYRVGKVTAGEYRTLLKLLNPTAPHITEELWELTGNSGHVYEQKWPEYDAKLIVEDTIEIAVQVNGKVRATISIARDEEKDAVLEKAKKEVEGKITGMVIKEIYVPGKIVNIVAK